LYQIESLCKTA